MTDSTYTSIIWLTQGKYALVDGCDYDFLNQWRWAYNKGYAYRIQYLGTTNGKRQFSNIRMHRLIMQPPKTMVIDHIDRNTLDNRRQNLRICTRSQNQGNRKATGGSSKYKGVAWDKSNRMWRAKIACGDKSVNLGSFSCEKDAAKAYNVAASKYFGEYGLLNEVG